MSIHKTEAIILSRTPIRETSLLVTVFTRDFGKIRGQLKGLHGEHGKFASTLEPFSFNEIVFYKSRYSEFNLISQCDLRDNFDNIRANPEAMYRAYLLNELTDALMQQNDINYEVFEFLFDCLKIMDKGYEPDKVLTIFQIKMLSLCGFKPHFDSCLSCFRKLDSKAYFSLSMGGILCDRCIAEDTEAKPINRGTISTILHIERETLQNNLRLMLTGKIKEELKQMLRLFFDFHLDKELRSRRLLKI